MPPNAIYVGRPTRWGNPFPIGRHATVTGPDGTAHGVFVTRHLAVEMYRAWLTHGPVSRIDEVRRELAGRDLACWCPGHVPCHGDVLIDLANRPLAPAA